MKQPERCNWCERKPLRMERFGDQRTMHYVGACKAHLPDLEKLRRPKNAAIEAAVARKIDLMGSHLQRGDRHIGANHTRFRAK